MGESGVGPRGARLAGADGRARLGVLLVSSGWFREVGLQAAGSETSRDVDQAGADIVKRIEEFADPVCDGVVFSPEDARRAARRMLEAGVDGVLLVPLMWCEDAIPRAALDLLRGIPLVLWSYSPDASLPRFLPFQTMLRGSGPVCAMQLSGMLCREGVGFETVVGHGKDPAVYAGIQSLARAMAVRRMLRGARIGLLPFPCEHMSSTWVDDFSIRARHGVELRPLELARVQGLAAGCGDRYLQDFRADMDRRGVCIDADEASLQEGIRYALALEAVIREEHLAGLAMNDVIPEMHQCFGLRPCLCNPGLSGSGVVVSMEADVGAAVAMLALRLFTGESPFYTEPFSVDYTANSILLGHAGYHDEANADPAAPVRIVPDVEYENSDRFRGAASYFKYRPGAVTGVNSVWDGEGLRWCCVQGQSVPGPARMEGNCHIDFHLDFPVGDFLRSVVERGVSQHWIFVPGHRAAEIEKLSGILGVKFVAIP